MDIRSFLKRCLFVFVLSPSVLTAQLFEDFSDGELLNDPAWTGDLQLFVVNTSYQLQLHDKTAGKASLFTPVQILEEMEWQCWVRQAFSPSANNHSRIYLAAEEPDTSGLPDGIFIQMGEGGSKDAVCLVVQSAGDTSTLIRGSEGMISSSFKCRIKVSLQADAWELLVDYTGGKDFQSEGIATLSLVPGTRNLGVYCKYTTSNSKKFYFDDVYAGPPQHDTIFIATRNDVVINEIMADPSPPAGLPEHEYLELYNITSELIDLYDWTLVLGSSEKSLTGAKIGPEGYLIIAKEDAFQELSPYGDFWGLEGFSLSNAGQEILLLNHRNELINHIYYRDHWYGDNEKDDGGFSLEMINPGNPCVGKENWGASDHFAGGSPGGINSIFDNSEMPVKILGVCARDKSRIQLVFNQSMHPDIIQKPDIFSINHGEVPLEAILPSDPWFDTFTLYPKNELITGQVYEISFNSFIHNCSGDSVWITESLQTGLSEKAGWNDIVINEVLFDPFPGGCDFVEIYNRSGRIISLSGMMVGLVKYSPPAPPDTSQIIIRNDCLAVLPGEYMVVCENKSGVENFYHCPDTRKFYEQETRLGLNKESGHIIIISPEGELLDALNYDEGMHFPLLNSTQGVSLERIQYNTPSQDVDSWHSASLQSGFATPGYRNSQYLDETEHNDPIHVSPRIFTPGYDGINDYISIHYKFGDPGLLANIWVFNSSGIAVRRLAENELLGTAGTICWNGLCDDNSKATAGLYIILTEILDIRGKVNRYKNSVVIAP